MSDRGLPIADGAQACPFVAFEHDRDERATSPDHRHRCYAEVTPAPRALAHQEAYCLASTFPICPTFQDWARREAAHARAANGGVGPSGADEPSRRNPPRDWSAPPPWADGAAGAGAAAASGASGAGAGGAGPGWPGAPGAAGGGSFDEEDEPEQEGDAPGFLSSRSAAAGAGLAGSAADRLAGGGPPAPDGGAEPDYGPGPEPDDDQYDAGSGEGYDEELDEDELEPRGRPRSARASGGISFGRDRRPRVGATRRAHGWDDGAPAWEPRRYNEPYPALKRRGLPRVSRVGAMAIALVLAAIALFFLPQLLGFGSKGPLTGNGSPTPRTSAGPSVSVAPTPLPAPTPQIYIVKSGDSMSRIAKMFGVTLDDLIAANRELHPNPDQLQIGDQVIIPTPPPGGSPAPSPSA